MTEPLSDLDIDMLLRPLGDEGPFPFGDRLESSLTNEERELVERHGRERSKHNEALQHELREKYGPMLAAVEPELLDEWERRRWQRPPVAEEER